MATPDYPVELRYIKALFLAAQYRQCIQACRDLIVLRGPFLNSRPLHTTVLSFYLGLCHDELARVMHPNSIAKMPAFNSAEQFYLEALQALPSSDEARLLCLDHDTYEDDGDPFVDDDTTLDLMHSPTSDGNDSFSLYSYSFSRASTPPLPSSPHFMQDLSFFSPLGSPKTLSMASDDDESHDSFSELVVSRGVLQRDVSSMSLLEETVTQRLAAHEQPRASQRAATTSHGLMRPIRLGSPPRQYHVPPSLPYRGTDGHFRSRLPQAVAASSTELQVAPIKAAETTPSKPPDSPISAIDPDLTTSDTSSTISAVSPQTPHSASRPASPASNFNNPGATALRLTDHISAMQLQLRQHLTAVQTSKQQLLQIQADRRAAREASKPTTTPFPHHPTRLTENQAPSLHLGSRYHHHQNPAPPPQKELGKPLQQAKSYWSFVPQDVKAAEKQARIAAGRQRKWKRERFDPGRYQELCELALAEL